MNYWFECKVGYEREAEGLGLKKVTETYLVDAMSFTEAEERLIKELSQFASMGPLEVLNIKRVKLAELFLNQRDEADRYYRAKVNFLSFDEKSGTEKKSGANMIIKAQDLPEAVAELTSQMEKQLGNYEIASVVETLIMDIFAYEPKS